MDVDLIETNLKNNQFKLSIINMLKENYKEENILESLCNISKIKDIKDITIEDSMFDCGSIFAVCLFIDQDNNIRVVELNENLIFGMVEYYQLHEDIKKDLIDSINDAFDEE